MELAKLIASFFVLFIHVPFPEEYGILVDGIGRFAVPMFFAITGYFNYQADSGRIRKWTKHLIGLYILAVALHLLWGCIVTEAKGGSTVAYLIQAIPDPDEFIRWLVVQTDPFSGQLWYLNSAIVTYGIFGLYVRFYGDGPADYRPLYFAAFSLFAVYFGFCVVTAVEQGTELLSSRNAWFTGIPMFTLGLFVREHQERIFRNYSLTAAKLWALIVVGVLLVVLEWDAIGISGMPLGTLLVIAGVFLLLVSHPEIAGGSKLILKCGPWSTWIYILHLIVYSGYRLVCQEALTFRLGETMEGWLRPLIVLTVSFLAAIVADSVATAVKRLQTCHK